MRVRPGVKTNTVYEYNSRFLVFLVWLWKCIFYQYLSGSLQSSFHGECGKINRMYWATNDGRARHSASLSLCCCTTITLLCKSVNLFDGILMALWEGNPLITNRFLFQTASDAWEWFKKVLLKSFKCVFVEFTWVCTVTRSTAHWSFLS